MVENDEFLIGSDVSKDSHAVAVAASGRMGDVRPSGDIGAAGLTEIRTPDVAREPMRDLVRAREAALQDRRRKRRELHLFLLQSARIYPGRNVWGTKYLLAGASYRYVIDPERSWGSTDFKVCLAPICDIPRRSVAVGGNRGSRSGRVAEPT